MDSCIAGFDTVVKAVGMFDQNYQNAVEKDKVVDKQVSLCCYNEWLE